MSKALDILWTGGWDSTFRVLSVSLLEKRLIQPHYIIDLNRRSTLRELQAISEIRKALRSIDSEAPKRVGDLQIIPMTEIPEQPAITESFQRLRRRSHLGGQYDWLARYAEHKGIFGLELCIHVDDKAYGFVGDKVEAVRNGIWRLDQSVRGDERIFSRFHFPLLHISKTEMRETAIKGGFINALEKSWFCFNPVNNQPCGRCNPCIYAIEEGMGYRLPTAAMRRYRTRWLNLPFRAMTTAVRKMNTRYF